jgi:hypothetical protein
MQFESIAAALNIRERPAGTVTGELLRGDRVEVKASASDAVWVPVKVTTGLNAGRIGFVRRKWLIQVFDGTPPSAPDDRTKAATIVTKRTREFDHIHYQLGDKAKTWPDLAQKGFIDCSGWVFLLAKEILAGYGRTTKPSLLYTFSDQQVTNVGKATGTMVSGTHLTADRFQPGCIVGIDFAEYAWDRNRPLDIDHVVMVGADAGDVFVSQSSSGGGGVNRVPLTKWLSSTEHLRVAGRMHLVDLLALP